MMIQNSFLLDEVRCGFLIPAAVKQAWAANLEVLAEIDRVCRKHNIQYFADWGTLLGTVRHGGFIPWDDDLDIVMKREDYIKFMTVARYDMEEGFDVQTYRNHEDCWLFMGKVVNRNGFSFEKEHLRRYHNFPYIACIDVFVLDYVHRDPEKEENRRKLCKYLLGVADAIGEQRLPAGECEAKLQAIEEMSGKKFTRIKDAVEMRRYLYGEVEKIFGEVPKEEADSLTQLFPRGLMGNAFHFPKEYYEESMYLPFECTYIAVPKLYDRMLRQRYDDYMRFVKNKAGHDYPFFEGQRQNLQKVLDFKLPEFVADRNKICRSEEENVYKSQSYKAMATECMNEMGHMKQQLAEIIGKAVTVAGGCEELIAMLMNQAIVLLQDSQQLAVDLGNMLESFLGEDCAIIGLLEQYCEALYQIYEQLVETSEAQEQKSALPEKELLHLCAELENQYKKISFELEQNVLRRKCVLFLPVIAKDWEYMQPLWEKTVQNPQCDALVVPLPYFYKDYDGSPRQVCYEAAEFPIEINALDYRALTSEYLELLHPEEIIIQNPYDNWHTAISVPDSFYALQLRKYTDKLVYLPPFVLDEFTKCNQREYSNTKYYVTMPGVVYADRVLVQSEEMRQLYVERLTEFAGEETKSIWEERIKAADKSSLEDLKDTAQEKPVKKSKKKILYGISVGAYLDQPEESRRKLEHNLGIFAECAETIEYSILLFPDIYAGEIKPEVVSLLAHCSYEFVSEKVDDLEDYDAYYGDAMPLVIRFRGAGKPVMIQDYACV